MTEVKGRGPETDSDSGIATRPGVPPAPGLTRFYATPTLW